MTDYSAKIKEIKARLGDELLILAHHYQKNEIVELADAIGDSLKLAQLAENNKTAKYIVFCGVYFMAETADILTDDNQVVLMPDKSAGCPMANMADMEQAQRAWEKLTSVFGESIIPLTYINSQADIKAFCGQRGGSTLTSGNAKKIVSWGLNQRDRVLFLPDQNLCKNTAFDLGVQEDEMAYYNPATNEIEYDGDLSRVRVILWRGYCHVHHKISLDKVEKIRADKPDARIIVHPECQFELVQAVDGSGSTEFIINEVKNAKVGSSFAIGTEANLVNRLIEDYADKDIVILDTDSHCVDMSLTTLKSLCETLEDIEKGDFAGRQVIVEKNIAEDAIRSLNVMLKLS